MSDELDQLLQGEDQNLPDGSQPGKQNMGSNPIDQDGQGGQGKPEEVEFNSLSGSAQERIRELVRQKNEALRKIQEAGDRGGYNPPPPPPLNPSDPLALDARNKLAAIGLATKDEVRDEVNRSLAQLQYGFELQRLGGMYNGSDGRPAFDKSEYEDYISSHPVYKTYLPEDVYRIMYREELSDWDQKKKSDQGQQRPHSRSLRPTSRGGTPEEQWTPEWIENRLKQTDGAQFYEKNVDKINAVLKASAPASEW